MFRNMVNLPGISHTSHTEKNIQLRTTYITAFKCMVRIFSWLRENTEFIKYEANFKAKIVDIIAPITNKSCKTKGRKFKSIKIFGRSVYK